MICPYCGSNEDRVIDSRSSDAGRVIRRRRHCVGCGKRFTTYERVEPTARLMVIKRDGTRVPFNRDNVMRGIQSACGKRSIPEAVQARVVDEVEDEVTREFEREVGSQVIGAKVMAKLKAIDDVAYIRFASEYHQFSAGDLRRELEELDARVKDVKDQRSLFGSSRDG